MLPGTCQPWHGCATGRRPHLSFEQATRACRRKSPHAHSAGLGRGGHGGGRIDFTAAAEALGLTEDELRAQTQAGSTLGDVAEEQAEADARAGDLEARTTDSLDELCGAGGRGGPGAGDDAEEDAAPSTAPSASTSADA